MRMNILSSQHASEKTTDIWKGLIGYLSVSSLSNLYSKHGMWFEKVILGESMPDGMEWNTLKGEKGLS